MIIIYLLCVAAAFIAGFSAGCRVKRPQNEPRKTREAFERELREFQPCLTCDHLRTLNPENDKYYTYNCEQKGKGFDIAPLYCKMYKEREGVSDEQES